MNIKKSTISVRSGLNSDEQHGCVVPPITLSTTYNFFGLNQPRPYDYSRRKNPTRDVAQQTLSDLEYGKNAIMTSSGMSAIYLICSALLEPNDLLIAPYDCYGGTYRLLDALSKKGAFKVLFIDQNDIQILLKSLTYKPKLMFIETPSNPMLRVVDIHTICNFKKDILYVVDNTFMTPVFQNPLTLGADLVVHSCSKYLNGHSDLIAGVVISKDTYISDKLTWWGNTLGITGSAFDSYQLLRGMRTLMPRVHQQQNNTKKIIDFFQKQPQINALYYPGLPTHPRYNIVCQQQSGFGSIFSFELKGTTNVLPQFLRSLKLFTLAESFGGVESLIAHPATMTHAAMPENARKNAGISDMLLRVSVGLEDSDDLIEDLKQAFASIQ
ncbi:cystathionine gamma-synthase [Blochmannia endosymbiont of Camponotus sp. C-003]|uniref:cystathionine gamma-synthase n=1 Tax=unclassified Candidatus Blochmanniella TaxID=711328 RepID=UPI0020250661|nr:MULTISPECIES: cystathionine gamma-synthase [unclassified Candidatus Blochmannia]URJ23260.1 cystathionine gamma-synthase [Blochmannia endosymbiont of Camponotus sp. C-003]URJ28729.1 cystathionine gamma-synthase [Blochmannia endosymbiont of Camponotus sp. C-046]